MDLVVCSAFAEELTKLAFNPKDALKMLRAAKKHQLRIGGRVGAGYGVVPTEKLIKKETEKAVGKLTSRGVEKPTARKALEALKHQQVDMVGFNPEAWAGKKAIIATPERGGATKWLASRGVPTKRIQTPEQKLMTEGVIKGHEVAERAAVRAPMDSFRGFGHLSPEVILKEHNMLVTMPKALRRKVAPSFQAMRRVAKGGQGEADVIQDVTGGKFRFGKSQRLSRHARKRVAGLVEEKARPSIEAGYGQLAEMAPSMI